MDLDWRAPATFVAGLGVLVAVRAVVTGAPRTLTWFVVGALVAMALFPLVESIQRRLSLRRWVAVGLVLATFVGLLALLAVLLGPAVARETRNVSADIPRVVRQLGDLPLIGDRLAENDIPRRVEQWLEDLPSRLAGDTAPIEDAAKSVLGGAVAAIATVLVTITLLLDGDRIVRGLRRVVPADQRTRADGLGRSFYRIVGRYFAGSLLVAVLAGTGNLIAGLALGVPLAPLVAVWVAVFNLVPQIGGAAGGIPFVLLGLTDGPRTGLACLVFFLTYQQFENHVLQPVVIGDAVDLSPPATMVAVLIGISAAGVAGALVAVPLLGVGKAFYLEARGLPLHAAVAPRPHRMLWNRLRGRRGDPVP